MKLKHENPVAAKGYSWADGFIRESVARSDGRDIFVHVDSTRTVAGIHGQAA